MADFDDHAKRIFEVEAKVAALQARTDTLEQRHDTQDREVRNLRTSLNLVLSRLETFSQIAGTTDGKVDSANRMIKQVYDLVSDVMEAQGKELTRQKHEMKVHADAIETQGAAILELGSWLRAKISTDDIAGPEKADGKKVG